MAENGIWGMDSEMCVLAHMLDTPIYSFQGDKNFWLCYYPHAIDRTIPENVFVQSMYTFLKRSHFQVVTAVRRRITS